MQSSKEGPKPFSFHLVTHTWLSTDYHLETNLSLTKVYIIYRMDCVYRLLYSMIAVHCRNYMLTSALLQLTSGNELVGVIFSPVQYLLYITNFLILGLFASQYVTNILSCWIFDLPSGHNSPEVFICQKQSGSQNSIENEEGLFHRCSINHTSSKTNLAIAATRIATLL